MIINSILFYITAIMLIGACVMAVISKKIMHSVFDSLITFVLVGFLFFALNAPLVGALQISVYGIALSILFAIAINLTNYEKEENIKVSPRLFSSIIGTLLISSSVLIMLKETMNYDSIFANFINNSHLLTSFDTASQISTELLYNNLIAFELLGIYLLIALIGISVLLVFKGGR